MSTVRERRFRHLAGARFALVVFFVVSFARPQDWILGLSAIPIAKIAGTLALLAFLLSLQVVRWPLPREAIYLFILLGQLFATVPMSSVWPGGAFQKTVDFAKVVIIFTVVVSVVISLKDLRRLIFIQTASVVVVAAVSLWKGHSQPGRLEGVLGGDYSNPNGLALAIVVSLPLCLVLMLLSRGTLRKTIWAAAMLLMIYVIFLTGSRGGFLSLIVIATMCLWEFSVQGSRRYLLVIVPLVGAIFWYSASGMLGGRLKGTLSLSADASNPNVDTASAYGSAQQRKQLFWRSIELTAKHPLFGIGPGNFQVLSGSWHVTHNSFTEMSSEGGVPAFILYVLILWSGFKNVRMTKRSVRSQKGLSLMAWGLRASLAGYVVGALFTSTAYELFPYCLIAYTTALAWIAKTSARRSKETPSHTSSPEKEIYAIARPGALAF